MRLSEKLDEGMQVLHGGDAAASGSEAARVALAALDWRKALS